jgi:hypothetical protein
LWGEKVAGNKRRSRLSSSAPALRLPIHNKQILFRSEMGVRSEMKTARNNDVFPNRRG